MVPSQQSHRQIGSRRVLPVTIALLLALLAGGCAIPEESFDGTLEGDYYINGVDPQGIEYSGLLTITATAEPDHYGMQWIITGSVQEGIGRVEGDRLFAEWDAIEGYDTVSYGTAAYTISANGELRGERVISGQEGAGREEAFPVKES